MTAKKKWNVMIYLVGDNNLSEEVAGSLADIRAVRNIPENIRVFGFFDGGNPMINSQFYDSTKPDPVSVDAEMNEVGETDEPAEINAASKNTIVNFAKKCQKLFPADEYIFVISGHGDGFLGRTLLRDENPGGNMTVGELKETFSEIKTVIEKPISILGFDSCLINMLELGYEFRQSAGIFLTSQGNVPNAGWNYKDMLGELVETAGGGTPEHYASRFVQRFIDFQWNFVLGGRSVELSANRLKIQRRNYAAELAAAVHRLGRAFVDNLQLQIDDKGKESEQLSDLLKLYRREIFRFILESHCECQTSMYEQAIDVKDFCELMLKKINGFEEFFSILTTEAALNPEINEINTNIKTALENVITAVENFVVVRGFCGAENQFTEGVSVFFPWTYVSYFMTIPKYEKLSFIKDYRNEENRKSGWEEFLKYYLLRTVREPEDKALREDKSNPRYGDKGLDGDTYLQYFSRIKNFNWNYNARSPENETETDKRQIAREQST
jgi:hypothetical protein